MALKKLFITVTDPDPKKTNRWNWTDGRTTILCIPDDNKAANTGKWRAVEREDVFGFHTGDNGWY
jgi:hypothetical protein